MVLLQKFYEFRRKSFLWSKICASIWKRRNFCSINCTPINHFFLIVRFISLVFSFQTTVRKQFGSIGLEPNQIVLGRIGSVPFSLADKQNNNTSNNKNSHSTKSNTSKSNSTNKTTTKTIFVIKWRIMTTRNEEKSKNKYRKHSKKNTKNKRPTTTIRRFLFRRRWCVIWY